MALIPRPIDWPLGSRSSNKSDFQVFEGDTAVGRICQTCVPDNPKWFWTLYVRVGEGELVPRCGLAETLEDAQTKFKAAWEKATSAKSSTHNLSVGGRATRRKKLSAN